MTVISSSFSVPSRVAKMASEKLDIAKFQPTKTSLQPSLAASAKGANVVSEPATASQAARLAPTRAVAAEPVPATIPSSVSARLTPVTVALAQEAETPVVNLNNAAAGLAPASGATNAEPAPAGRPISWASAWRDGWNALVDASKTLQSLAQKASAEGLSAGDRELLNAQFREVASQVISYGESLFNQVRPQLGASQVASWQNAFSFRNLGIGAADSLNTADGAKQLADKMDATANRFANYNNFMQAYHKNKGWM
jgi:hypothetical protein